MTTDQATIKEKLKGKKRYIALAGVALTALAMWLGGDITPAEAIQMILQTLGLAVGG